MAPADPVESTTAVAAVAPSETSSDKPKRSQTNTPFSGLKIELNEDLQIVLTSEPGEKETSRILKEKHGKKNYLPGQPRIKLKLSDNIDVSKAGDKDRDENPLFKYLKENHSTEGLDELLPFMRYIFVQTPSYRHIMPLHHQKSHAREIKVTENPGLHLVWYYEMIFIKPIPAYFYSRAFWEFIQDPRPELYAASLGFMRTYYWLIQYELDFQLACKLELIPAKSDGQRPTYEEWCDFIEPFALVGDDHVNRRYHYGELRLSRINRAAMLFRGNLAYFHIYPQWGSFLEHTLAPIITVFAVCSVVLNSMQVSLAAIEVGNEVDIATLGAWPRFLDASLWFPVVVMLSIAVVIAAALLGMGVMGVKDVIRGNDVRRKKKSGDPHAGTRSHGMVW